MRGRAKAFLSRFKGIAHHLQGMWRLGYLEGLLGHLSEAMHQLPAVFEEVRPIPSFNRPLLIIDRL